MVPEAAERCGVPLERATGLSGVVERLAATIGPAAGGGLVAWLGPLAGLTVNAASFALGWLIVAVTLPAGMGAVPGGRSKGRATGRGSGRGWRFSGATGRCWRWSW
ncbi:hypothetical protein D7319_03660 [Streptomyces radicis]|uniref:Uncharacterized protein n=1 Tax=Streptomyces radicis TaxID=1750517 RepID=A0A3A9WFC7_9ACTN|nr:hypothetical protein D7319_03660 [Streptomyces radicis]RKN25938.1 hypothetical protein D7318_06820 [Streptomyces radicis]